MTPETPSPDAPIVSAQWPSVEHLQSLLPQYEIASLIGRGGMGAVYKGRQLALDRHVAIKILPHGGDTEFAARFKDEARTLARLHHPGIVTVFESGETSEGQFYFVMEHVDGIDLAQLIGSNGPLPPERARNIATQVCDALAYAHANGVIHRDIKPANILIDSQGRVKVADFGLARREESPGATMMTQTGMTMGTPGYLAPETLLARAPVDSRADLYAVGVMLYQMLTGEVPAGLFKMPGVLSGGAIDPRYDAIITRAMQTKLDARYQSAAELRADLDAIVATPRKKNANSRTVTKTNRALVLGIAVCAIVAGWFIFNSERKTAHAVASTSSDNRWTDGLAEWWRLPQKGESEVLLAKEAGASRLVSTRRKGVFLADGGKRKDVNIRATVRGITDYCALHVRHQSPDNYQAVLFKDGATKIVTSGPHGSELIRGAAVPGFDPAASHVFEFTATGDDLSVRVDGVQTCAVSGGTLDQAGMFFFTGDTGTLIEKLEYR